MDCEHDKVASDSTPGAPWYHVNMQHGLLGWTLGELYGIPDCRSGREQGRGAGSVTADMTARLADSTTEAGRSHAPTAEAGRSHATTAESGMSYAAIVPAPLSLSRWLQGQEANTDKPDAALAVTVPHPERVRLTSYQAVDIFNAKKTKTSRTAGLLSAEYGVSAKAIRDIWVRRSWDKETRGLGSDDE
eukprot:CAMPEP_0179442748 /NCGR_PEP_ID=MMETSP0799-20121207/26246_1 /TAXON_ID=46947 /ORGANISM="Geminigera cryophila, Strain CCMP2564" /LENGTH=188 /DNA_ID=CAMNT_0021228205 /DNA_START=23 /DNA_END=589 /DNA_ORIENTATION=-